eukprot:345220-Hanusia_phi.AAC.2
MRTWGGDEEKILLLRYHLGRLMASMRILFPDVDVRISKQDQEEVSAMSCNLKDSHPRLAYRQLSSPCILFAGEADSGGRVAAKEVADLVAGRTGSERVMELSEAAADMLAASEFDFFVLVVECEQDGELVMPARKFLRAMKKIGAGRTASKFCTLCLASSTCSFSSMSAGDDKFKGGRKLTDAVKLFGLQEMCKMSCLDVGVEDIVAHVQRWTGEILRDSEQIVEDFQPERHQPSELEKLVLLRTADVVQGLNEETRSEGGDVMIVVLCSPIETGGI